MKKKIISILVVSIMMTVGILTFHPTTTVKAGGAPKTIMVYIGEMSITGGQYNQEYAYAYDVNVGGLNSGDTVNFYFKYKIIGDTEVLIERWQFEGMCKINNINYANTYFLEETDNCEYPGLDDNTPNWMPVLVYSYQYQGPVAVQVTITATYWSTDWGGYKWPIPSGYSASDTSNIHLGNLDGGVGFMLSD